MFLSDKQKLILDVFKKSNLADKFYWTGGTLLSFYYLKHRYSSDMDFFSEKEFHFDLLLPFLSELKKIAGADIEEHKIFDRWEFIVIDKNKDKTRIDFVYYNHEKKRLKPLIKYSGMLIDSLDDIAANKTMAYFDRNEPKDLFDLYVLLTKGKYQVNKLLQLVEMKFGVKFNEFMFWSESAKSLKLLDTLSPLYIQKTDAEKKKLKEDISEFFLNTGSDFLEKQIRSS